jgi:hypothetical protein
MMRRVGTNRVCPCFLPEMKERFNTDDAAMSQQFL